MKEESKMTYPRPTEWKEVIDLTRNNQSFEVVNLVREQVAKYIHTQCPGVQVTYVPNRWNDGYSGFIIKEA